MSSCQNRYKKHLLLLLIMFLLLLPLSQTFRPSTFNRIYSLIHRKSSLHRKLSSLKSTFLPPYTLTQTPSTPLLTLPPYTPSPSHPPLSIPLIYSDGSTVCILSKPPSLRSVPSSNVIPHPYPSLAGEGERGAKRRANNIISSDEDRALVSPYTTRLPRNHRNNSQPSSQPFL